MSINMFLLSLLFYVATSETCPAYKCKSTSEQFSDQTCIFYEQKGEIYHIEPCEHPVERICLYSEKFNSTCSAPKKYNTLKYPGEKCMGDEECRYASFGGCIKGYCKGSIDFCTDNSFCEPGYFCKSNSCVSQLNTNEICQNDFECKNDSGCDGVCKKYLSAQQYETVNKCENGTNYVCESTRCFANITENLNYCLSFLPRLQYSAECQDSTNCISKTDHKLGVSIQSECKCGMNPYGRKYCEVLNGDVEFLYYLQQLVKWYQSDNILKCNTLRRENKVCIQDQWDQENALKLVFYKERIINFPRIQDNDYCGEMVLNREFYELAHKFGHLNTQDPHLTEADTNLAEKLVLGLMILLVN